MKIFTKEWHELSDFLGTTEMFEPVIDKEYTDDEIENLYQDMLEKYIQEEQSLYDEPPFFDPDEWKEMFPEDEFDPEDFLIGDIEDENGEVNLRNPASYEELLDYRQREFEQSLLEYEERETFNEEEAAEEFEEDYRDNLEEPDEDIPEWIRASVDKRLLAMYVLPESVYKKLRAEEEEVEARFEKLDAEVERLLEEKAKEDEGRPEECEEIEDILDDVQAEFITGASEADGSYELELVSWDDEGDYQIRRIVSFTDAELIENEQPDIRVSEDEDGDTESNCDLRDYELYYADGKYEIHLLLDNEENGLKYVTLRCSGVVCE